MLNKFDTPKYIWVEAVKNILLCFKSCYLETRVEKDSCELWRGRKPNISYFKDFCSKCFILNTKDNLENFD